MTYIKKKKESGKHCVGGMGLVDNDPDPSIAHPPTEDHPLTDSLVFSLAVQELLITITTQSGANEPGCGGGGGEGARFVSEQSRERNNRAQTGTYCTILWASIGEMWAIHPPSFSV